MTLLLCRFCAESELGSEVIDFSSDIELKNEIVKNLAIIHVDDVDLTDKSLPEAVCTYCREILSLCCNFLLKVRNSQAILRGHNENAFSKNYNIFDEHSTRYEVKKESSFDTEVNEEYGLVSGCQGDNNFNGETEEAIQIEQDRIHDPWEFEKNPLKLEENEVNIQDTLQFSQQSDTPYTVTENIAHNNSLKDITCGTTRATGNSPLLTNLLTTTKELICNTSLINKCLNSSTLKLTPPSEFLPNLPLRFEAAQVKELKQHKSIDRAMDGLKSQHSIKSTKNDLTCDTCHAVFHKQNHLNEHKLRHSETKRDIKCDKCGKSYVKIWDLKAHIKDVHKIEPQACPICKKVFQNDIRLKRHAKLHAGIKYECDICHRTFKTRGNTAMHIKTNHSDGPNYLCKFCGKGFKARSHWKNHEDVHMKKTPYTCTECGRKFTQWGNCNSHMNRMHGLTLAKTVKTPLGRIPIDQKINDSVERNIQLETQKRDFSCNACCRKFNSQKVLSDHQKIAHHNSKTQQVCPICNKEYANFVTLKTHLKIHEGRTFECDYCHRKYKQKKTLERHIGIHNRNQWRFRYTGSTMSLYLDN